MNEKELEDIRQDLLERRENLQRRIKEENDKVNENKSENLDPADLAQDYNFRQRISSIVDRYELEIVEINNALRRIEEGSFGTCENCGATIPIERLRAMPQAKLCIRCQTEHRVV
jgi:DnaK suppressor protein